MKSGWAYLALCCAIGTSVAQAAAPDRSLRPVGRPLGVAAEQPVIAAAPQVPVYFEAKIRPKPRTRWSGTAVLNAIDRVSDSAVVTPVSNAAPTATPTPTAPVTSTVPVYFNAEIRPKARPWIDRTRPAGSVVTPLATGTSGQQQPNPDTPVAAAGANTPAPNVRVLASSAPVFSSPRPPARPANLQRRSVAQTRVPTQSTPAAVAGRAGAICGNSAIRGRTIPAIAGRLAGCGIANPVQVTAVGGVSLSTPATMNCETAQALLTWTENGAKPAVGRLGGGIASYRIVAHYSCRTRNSQPGARISEHGKGRAVDIAAIKLNNGVDITILNGWKDPTQGPILRGMWRAACGPFGTVLGPEANRFHLDHFHFDTAAYRSGSYCR